MRKILLLLFIVTLSGCGVNVLEVCGEESESCSTGWYDHNGDVVTTAHGKLEDESVTIRSQQGFEQKGLDKHTVVAYDVVAYETDRSYRPRVCYRDAEVGDAVTVSTRNGTIRTSIIKKGLDTYMIEKKLKKGDSGSPVTYRGCIIGVVRLRNDRGTLIVALRKERK